MKRNYVSTQAIEHSNPTGRHDHAVAKIDAAIKIVREQLYLQPERRSAFDDLVACARARTLLLRPAARGNRSEWTAPVFLLNRLRNLADRQGQ